MSLDSLPPSLLARIVDYLDDDDRLSLQSCCKYLLKNVEKVPQLHLRGWYHTLKFIGDGNMVRMELGVQMRVTVSYDRFEELMEIPKFIFDQCSMEIAYVQNIDFNKIAAERVEPILDQFEMKSISFEIKKEEYHEDVFSLIQRLENRSKIQLEMHDFILSEDQLLSLRPTGNLRATGGFPYLDDRLVLELINRRHISLNLSHNILSPETARDAIKLVSEYDDQQHALFHASESIFRQFVDLTGACFVKKRLVMEDTSTGFSIGNDGFIDEEGREVDYCTGDYCIVYDNAHCWLSQEWEEDRKTGWSLTIVRTMDRPERDEEKEEN